MLGASKDAVVFPKPRHRLVWRALLSRACVVRPALQPAPHQHHHHHHHHQQQQRCRLFRALDTAKPSQGEKNISIVSRKSRSIITWSFRCFDCYDFACQRIVPFLRVAVIALSVPCPHDSVIYHRPLMCYVRVLLSWDSLCTTLFFPAFNTTISYHSPLAFAGVLLFVRWASSGFLFCMALTWLFIGSIASCYHSCFLFGAQLLCTSSERAIIIANVKFYK